MSLPRTSHVVTIVAFELRRLVRAPHGILFLVGVGCYYLWLAMWLEDISDEMDQATAQLEAMQGSGAGAMLHEVIGWWTDLDASAVDGLLTNHPPLLVATFVLTVLLTPLLAMLASFDQTASDIRTRHIRFMLLRTDRASLFTGKAIGSLLFFAIAQVVATSLVAAVLWITGGVSGLDSLTYVVRIAVTAIVFAVPFVSLMAMCGAITGNARLALLMGFAIQLLIWAASGIGGLLDESLKVLRFGFPTAMKYHLVSDAMGDIGLALVHQGVLIVVFLALGWTVLRRRDV